MPRAEDGVDDGADPLLLHLRDFDLHADENTALVDRKQPLVLFDADVGEIDATEFDTCVVVGDIESPERVDCLCEQVLEGGEVGDVGLDGNDVLAAAGVFGCSVGSVLIDIGDRDPGAVFNQYLRSFTADSAATSGDDCDLSVQRCHDGSTFLFIEGYVFARVNRGPGRLLRRIRVRGRRRPGSR